jgi:hypothetical protein
VLSYYPEEKLINQKMLNFGIELSDLIMNKYELFFKFPSPEELYDKHLPLLSQSSLDITDDELYWKCVAWSQQELKNKIAHFPLMHLSICDAVHATLLKALRGETMKSLRTMGHIHQNMGQAPLTPLQPQRRGLFGGGGK